MVTFFSNPQVTCAKAYTGYTTSISSVGLYNWSRFKGRTVLSFGGCVVCFTTGGRSTQGVIRGTPKTDRWENRSCTMMTGEKLSCLG